jgi:5-methylthioadenosine/S-adenosylhomocysteine deaminase
MTTLFSESVLWPDGAIGPGRIRLDGRFVAATERGPRGEGDVDLGGRLVTPAFVNAHTHLAMTAFRGLVGASSLRGNVVEELYFRVETALGPDDVRAFARVGATEALLTGTACVWDHYYHADALVDGLEDAGICAVVAPTLQDLAGPGVADLEAQLDATARLDDDARRRERGLVAALGPHATDTVSDGLWARVCDVADARGLPIHAHCAQSHEEVDRSFDRHGLSPVARLHERGFLARGPAWLLVHALYASGPDLDRLDPARHTLGWCPLAQAQFHFPARPDAWRSRGLSFVLGTDAGACNDSIDVQAELRAASAALGFAASFTPDWDRFAASGARADADRLAATRTDRHGPHAPFLDPATVLGSVWTTPGGLHPKLPLGRIAPGHVANLALWDLGHPAFWPAVDPLRSLLLGSVTGALDGLVVAGRWRARPGRVREDLLDAGYREAASEATGRLRALARRAGIT